jgi:hypothetical protein
MINCKNCKIGQRGSSLNHDQISDLSSKLAWNNLLTRRKKHKALPMFKTINELTPHYLYELFESRSTGYNLRNSGNTLFVRKPRTNYGKRSFSYIAGHCYGTSYRKMYEQHAL